MSKEDAPVNPVFDDSRKALEFALNASRAEMPRPFMNKAMADAVAKKEKKRKKPQALILLSEDDPRWLLEQERLAATRRRTLGPPSMPPLSGLDRAHQAGFILSQLERLDHIQKVVLKGLMIHAYDPCACRAACCSGSRRNLRWAEAVKETCLYLEHVGEVTRIPGKKGLSTQPELRLAFVEQYFTKNSMSLVDAASLGKVSVVTATRHREWIFTYLEQTESEAWLSIDAIFDQVGITGAIL